MLKKVSNKIALILSIILVLNNFPTKVFAADEYINATLISPTELVAGDTTAKFNIDTNITTALELWIMEEGVSVDNISSSSTCFKSPDQSEVIFNISDIPSGDYEIRISPGEYSDIPHNTGFTVYPTTGDEAITDPTIKPDSGLIAEEVNNIDLNFKTSKFRKDTQIDFAIYDASDDIVSGQSVTIKRGSTEVDICFENVSFNAGTYVVKPLSTYTEDYLTSVAWPSFVVGPNTGSEELSQFTLNTKRLITGLESNIIFGFEAANFLKNSTLNFAIYDKSTGIATAYQKEITIKKGDTKGSVTFEKVNLPMGFYDIKISSTAPGNISSNALEDFEVINNTGSEQLFNVTVSTVEMYSDETKDINLSFQAENINADSRFEFTIYDSNDVATGFTAISDIQATITSGSALFSNVNLEAGTYQVKLSSNDPSDILSTTAWPVITINPITGSEIISDVEISPNEFYDDEIKNITMTFNTENFIRDAELTFAIYDKKTDEITSFSTKSNILSNENAGTATFSNVILPAGKYTIRLSSTDPSQISTSTNWPNLHINASTGYEIISDVLIDSNEFYDDDIVEINLTFNSQNFIRDSELEFTIYELETGKATAFTAKSNVSANALTGTAKFSDVTLAKGEYIIRLSSKDPSNILTSTNWPTLQINSISGEEVVFNFVLDKATIEPYVAEDITLTFEVDKFLRAESELTFTIYNSEGVATDYSSSVKIAKDQTTASVTFKGVSLDLGNYSIKLSKAPQHLIDNDETFGDLFVFISSDLKIGDSVRLGTYYSQPIDWIIVDFDENGSPLLFSEKILSLKNYDGNKNPSNSSNNWEQSSIRKWLNSSEFRITDWKHTPSHEWEYHFFGEPYHEESGFLYNFTEVDRNSIKTVTRRQMVNEYKWTTGEQIRNDDFSSINYESSAFKSIDDKVFFLGIEQIRNLLYNNPQLRYLIRPELSSAADAKRISDATNANQTGLMTARTYFTYYTGTLTSKDNQPSDFIITVSSSSMTGDIPIRRDTVVDNSVGIRPALYLENGYFENGNGTAGNPYSDFRSFTEKIEVINNLTVKNNRIKANISNDIEAEYKVENLRGDREIEFVLMNPATGEEFYTSTSSVSVDDEKGIVTFRNVNLPAGDYQIRIKSGIRTRVGEDIGGNVYSRNYLNGTAYLYQNGIRTPLVDAAIRVVDIGYTTTDSDGKYELELPILENTVQSVTVNTQAADKLVVSQDGNSVSSLGEFVFNDFSKSNDIEFVNYLAITGTVKNSSTNAVIAGAAVNYINDVSTVTSSSGTFRLENAITRMPNSSESYSISASKQDFLANSSIIIPTVQDFKNGYCNVTISLQPIPTSSVFNNKTKNYISVDRYSVPKNKIMYVTLNFMPNTAQTSVSLQLTVPKGITILPEFSLYKIGTTINNHSFPHKSYSYTNDVLTIVTNAIPTSESITVPGTSRKDSLAGYKAVIPIRVSNDFNESSFKVSGSIVTTNNVTHVLGAEIVNVSNITLEVPESVIMLDSNDGNFSTEVFNVFGEVSDDKDVKVDLQITSPSGKVYEYSGFSLEKGLNYRINEISLNDAEYGLHKAYAYAYTLDSGSQKVKQGEATKYFNVIDVSASIKPLNIKLSATDKSTGKLINPIEKSLATSGTFASYTIFMSYNGKYIPSLGNIYAYYDIHYLNAETTVSNPNLIKSAKYILKTHLHQSSYVATVDGNVVRATGIGNYYGTSNSPTPTLTLEITRTDGTVVRFLVANITMLFDPSGFVTDFFTGEPVEGATATLYYKLDDGSWKEWEAELYNQINPQTTNSEGYYGWFVDEGIYRVDIIHEDYHDYSTLDDEKFGEIHVLPPRTDVNIMLYPKMNRDNIPAEDNNDYTYSSASKKTRIETPINHAAEIITKYNGNAKINYNQTLELNTLELEFENPSLLKDGSTIMLSAPNGFKWHLNALPTGTERFSMVNAKVEYYKDIKRNRDESKLLITLSETDVSKNKGILTFEGLELMPTDKAKIGKITVGIYHDNLKSDEIIVGELSVSSSDNTAQIDSYKLTVNSKVIDMDVEPFILNGHIMLPVRYISQVYGIDDNNIKWDETSKQVSIVNGNDTAVFTINSHIMSINDTVHKMDVDAVIKDGRTFISIYELSKTFGIDLSWNEREKKLTF